LEEIKTGNIIPLNLPLNVPNIPAFNREPFQHKIKSLWENVAYNGKYQLNTQSGTQWDEFKHIPHIPTESFYNSIKGTNIEGDKKDLNKYGIHH
jgi:hypothetical protein